MHGRGELPREVGLQLRMGVALTLSSALFLAAAGGLLYLAVFVEDGWSVVVMLVGIVGVGAQRTLHAKRRRRPRRVPKEAERRLRRVAQRLSVVANVPAPDTRVVGDRVPLSWTFAPLRGSPTIHATTGLLDRLEDRELQAVVAHELGHLIHRDAVVVTLLAGPPAYLFTGLRAMADEGGLRMKLGALMFGLFFGPPALLLLLLSRVVSRDRELAADRAAAMLTGSPASVAAALLAVDGGLRHERDRDLRRVAPRNAFHFVPTRVPRLVGRLWATHPPLRRRVERMERLEAAMQASGSG